jgi:flagellar biogenesis protein FliO
MFEVKKNENGQSTIEFSFAMMVTLIIVVALILVFRWVGMDYANRRFTHEQLLTNDSLRPEQQLNPDFYRARKIDAAYRGLNLL